MSSRKLPLAIRTSNPSPRQKFAINVESAANARYRAPALDKGLDILELLCAEPQPLTRGEIDKALGWGPSEGYRMLERLVARRYVVRSPEGDRYSPSLRLLMLAQQHPPLNRLLQQAHPRMQAFAAQTEQSCHLGLYENGNIKLVAEALGPGKLVLSVRTGSEVSLVDTGSGHVLLAFQSPERRAAMLAEHSPLEGETTIDAVVLENRLERVRSNGYWQDDSQHLRGITDIAVPLLGPDGQAYAALTCPYITRIDHFVGIDVEKTRALLVEAAKGLSMGYRPLL